MSRRVLILVEGQTEESFVKNILDPEYSNLDFYPRIIATKEVKNGSDFKGGVVSYGKFKNHMQRLLNDKSAIVTTMIDYHGLPPDFPGMDTRPTGTSQDKVSHVEQAICEDLGRPQNFFPFLSLHEFEALLFSSEDVLPRIMAMDDAGRAEFGRLCGKFETPEMINEEPGLSPSRRILKISPDYKKIVHGIAVAKNTGLGCIKDKCPHFAKWLGKIENCAD